MNRSLTSSLTTSVYKWLLHLYPVSFHSIFADEMAEVFGAALREARQRGRSAALTLFARELAMLPLTAVVQHLRDLKLTDPSDGPAINPLAWHKVFWAIFPGLMTLFPVLTIIGFTRETPLALAVTCLLPLSAALLTERRMTLWSLPGLGLLISWGLWIGSPWVLVVGSAAVLAVLIWQTLRRRAELWLHWLLLGAMVLTGVTAWLLAIMLTGTLHGVLTGGIFAVQLAAEFNRSIFPVELALYVVAAGLPFARRFGASAVLASLSAMMWPIFGMLNFGGQAMGLGQQLEVALPLSYIALLLVILPLWVFRSASPRGRFYGAFFPLFGALIGGAGVVAAFWGVRSAVPGIIFVLESLLGLALACVLYEQIGRRSERLAVCSSAASQTLDIIRL